MHVRWILFKYVDFKYQIKQKPDRKIKQILKIKISDPIQYLKSDIIIYFVYFNYITTPKSHYCTSWHLSPILSEY